MRAPCSSLVLAFALALPLQTLCQTQSSSAEDLHGYLNLTPKQTQEIEKIAQKTAQETKEKREKADELLRNNTDEHPEYLRQLETIGAQIEKQQLAANAKMLRILSPSQRERLDELAEQKEPQPAFKEAASMGLLVGDATKERQEYGGTSTTGISIYQKSDIKKSANDKRPKSDKATDAPQPQ
jgi:Spy/CpxP family protein refolding chaperone